ncbi:uncharacterized protein LTR77_010518 [Saxophila tyrrhenica]|uniref:Uncharacterized protein n=1 Tax=Saxophila tyrrhenica TaxID=1690608 RepID=A0AAV9NYM0_9PEZI|nr:hypothetical protein LTR77_010518 [Saxophila tyrrhenica]
MSESNDDHAILKLTPNEKAAYSHLFSLADSDSLGVVTGERAVSFFEKTHVPAPVLGEIWQIADTENRGLLTKPGFCMVVRLIGWWQNGQQQPSAELAFKPAPIPKFDGIALPTAPQQQPQSPTGGAFPANALQPQLSGQSAGGGPIRVPALDPGKVQQYSGLFERSGAQNGILDGGTAKSIFERAGLPNEVLGRIWMLSDREQRGGLDQTEFIVAMHLLTSMKTRAMTSLPTAVPQGLWDAALRRGQRPPSRQMSAAGAVPRQFTGGSMQQRTQSPLARGPDYSSQALQAQSTGAHWLVTQQEKGQFDQFFSRINPSPTGLISGEQAVNFFSNSNLSEDTLAQIWDLSDIDSDGQLSRDEFAVAMYLIKQQRLPNAAPLPAFLPPALVPPSMRNQQQQQQAAQTAPPPPQVVPPPQKMSAADDLFGLDSSPTQSQSQPAALQPQSTGASATASRDPFSGTSAPGSPGSPARFQQPQSTGSMFKPFVPTSAFGTSLVQQNTGASSNTSSQPQAFSPSQSQGPSASFMQPQNQQRGPGAPMPSNMDDLLGDSDAHAEESSRITNDTTELANMSSQIGNLRNQMESTQAKKSATQADVDKTNAQKRDLEQRLQQFRGQYETEVKAVKELEAQLTSSRSETKRLGQELAMLEGTYQDLSTQHQSVSQQLQADQQENANLKQRMSQLNAEVSRMKPEIEKMKLDARQQRGMVSINKKQMSTNEAERDRLVSEKADLEREAAEMARSRTVSPEPAMASQASNVGSPAASMASTNPFFNKASTGPASPPPAASSGPTPSAFDQLFGPSSAFAPSGQAGSRAETPPATSFIGRSMPAAGATAGSTAFGASAATASMGMTDSVSSAGEATPAATPPPRSVDPTGEAFLGTPAPDSAEPERVASPPPPPESRQFTPTNLPLGGGVVGQSDPDAASTRVMPPASRAGDAEPEREMVPGAFPSEEAQPTVDAQELSGSTKPSTQAGTPAPGTTSGNVNDDFDAAFAGFGESDKAKDGAEDEDPFASKDQQAPPTRGFNDEFPPIQSLELDNESDSSSDDDDEDKSKDRGFGDDFAAPSTTQQSGLDTSAATTSSAAPGSLAAPEPANDEIPTPGEELPDISKQTSPPTYEQSDNVLHGGTGERSGSNSFPREYGDLLPSREDPTSPPPPTTSPPVETTSATFSDDSVTPPAGDSAPQSTAPEETVSRPPPRVSSLQQGSYSSASGQQPLATPGTDIFVDASSRPMSSVTDAGVPTSSPPTAQSSSNAFDDFDDFADLSETKEADKNAESFDFGFGGRQSVDEFNPAFDSPAPSNAATPIPATRSVQQSQDSGNGFADFMPNVSQSAIGQSGSGGEGTGSIQQTPQASQHDWDAIFSGLDNSKDIDTSFPSNGAATTNDDPWSTVNGSSTTNSSAAAAPSSSAATQQVFQPPPGPPPGKAPLGADRGGAITPGTEHDDPILKRLTGMGYARGQALNALEMYDYDINKAVDHLAGQLQLSPCRLDQERDAPAIVAQRFTELYGSRVPRSPRLQQHWVEETALCSIERPPVLITPNANSTMSSDNKIIFYDIASNEPARTFAPNPWKSRFALNFKGLAYRTQWVDLPDICSVRQELGVGANRTLPNGEPFHTLPMIKDHSTGNLVGDSFEIALHLDRTYPDAPRLILPNTTGLTAAFNNRIDSIFTPYAILVDQMPFREPEAAKAVMLKRFGATSWDDLKLSPDAREATFLAFEAALGELAKAYQHMGGTTDHVWRAGGTDKAMSQRSGREEVGPWLDGEGPVYADFVVGAWLKMLEMGMAMEEWERVRGWQGGLWGRIVDALEPWCEIK